MPNPMTINDAADLLDKAVDNVWLKGSEGQSEFYKQYYNVQSTENYQDTDSSLSGLGYAGRIVENAVPVAQTPVQGFDKTFTQVEYGVLMTFTKRMWKFGIQKRNLTKVVNEAWKACSDLRELRCAERLVNGHSTSYTATDDTGNYTVTTTGGDSAALFSASHTREDGGTNNNNIVTDGSTVNMDWEYDALKAAYRTAALVRNPKGKPMNINLDTLVLAKGYANNMRAMEMLAAMKAGKMPGTTDHDGTAVPAFKILALPWIMSNTDYWWMFDSGMKNQMYGLQYFESQPIEKEGPHVVFKTDEIQYKATMLFEIGHNDYRGWVGSKNTNAA